MRIKLLGSTGVIRYSKEIYLNARRLHGRELSITQDMCTSMPFIGAGLAFPIRESFKDFSKYDIIHNLPCYPFFPFRKKDAALVTTAHEFQAVLYPELNKMQEIGIRDRVWTNFIAKPGIASAISSDLVVANSIQTMNEAISLGIPRKKVRLTQLGVDSRFLKDSAKPKTNKKTFKVGFIGTLSPRKNVLFLINAFKKIEDDSIFLELWGKSIYPDKVIAEAIGSDKRITWKGFAPETRFVEIYDSFDAFAYPSLYEGFGLPILEAKARGLPVVIFKTGKISPEVREDCFKIKDGKELASTILKLKSNGYNERTRDRSIKRARSFTWEKTAEETVKAYHSLA